MAETNDYKILKNAYSDKIESIITNLPHYHPYLITTGFKFIPFGAGPKPQYMFISNDTWNIYSKCYRHLISNIMNNFTKKSHLYPKTFDFLDVDGTRNNPRAAFTENTIPHIHSIYLVHEQTLGRFQTLASNDFQSIVLHPSLSDFLRVINAKPITETIPHAVSYCSKFFDNHYARRIRDDYPLFNQFPLAEFEKEALKHQRERLPFNLLNHSRREMKQRFRECAKTPDC